MTSINDRRRTALSPAGFGLLGKELFATRPLGDLLREKSQKHFWDVAPFALSWRQPSKLQVRRDFIGAVTIRDAIVLGDMPELKFRQYRGYVQVEATFSFSGDPAFFDAMPEQRSGRALRGLTEDKRLRLGVRSDESDLPMVPYALTSEIIAVRDMLTAQGAAIDRHNLAQASEMKAFVDERWESLLVMRPYAIEAAATSTALASAEIQIVQSLMSDNPINFSP